MQARGAACSRGERAEQLLTPKPRRPYRGAMSPPSDRVAASEARDHRRWLIGLGITLAFGLFGVIMALLSYSARTRPGASSPAQSPAAPHAEPAKRPRGRHDRDK